MPAKKERVHVLPERHSDSLPAGQSGDRIPVGVRYSAPVQTGPEAHPASYTMGTGSFLGVKRSGFGVDHLRSSAEVEGRVKLYICSPSGPSWAVLGWTLHVLRVTWALWSNRVRSGWWLLTTCGFWQRHSWRYGCWDVTPCWLGVSSRVYIIIIHHH